MKTVFILVEETEQSNYVDNYGETAYPISNIIGVYQNKEKAELKKKHLEEQINDALLDEEMSYYIEERPLL